MLELASESNQTVCVGFEMVVQTLRVHWPEYGSTFLHETTSCPPS